MPSATETLLDPRQNSNENNNESIQLAQDRYKDERDMEMPIHSVYRGNTGIDTGISTIGFRTGRFNPEDWENGKYAVYYQAFADRDSSEKVRQEADRLIQETEATTSKNQKTSTKKMKERIHDINFWKNALEKEWHEILQEIEKLESERKRFERAYSITEVALHVPTDNLNCRDRRLGLDKIEDAVEIALIKEIDIINKTQDLYRKSVEEIGFQIEKLRDVKKNIEMDWSNKKEAEECDLIGACLTNGNTNKQHYAGVARPNGNQSLPEDWAQFSHDNIATSEVERMVSMQLRTIIMNIINDCSSDMRTHADHVESALMIRIRQLEDAKAKLVDHLTHICKEIAKQEQKSLELSNAIRRKEDPIKVAQTRLHARMYRPGVDFCKDSPQFHITGELQELQQCIDALTSQLQQSEEAIKRLSDTRMALEKDVAMTTNSIFIDKEKCLTHRERSPSLTQLRGYQNTS